MVLDPQRLARGVDHLFETAVIPALVDYVAIECLSPEFDAQWAAHGHIDRAADFAASWAQSRDIEGLTSAIRRLDGRTPVVLIDVEASSPSSGHVVIYGHLDKQPPLGEWRQGLGPFTAVREGDLLYGRGAADDGYAVFCALSAIEALRAAGGEHPRVTLLIELSEESGSPDLPAHLETLSVELGQPQLVLCLDSGALSFDRLWATSSLRGLVSASITAKVLETGVHSGLYGAVVPDSFRVLRQLLDRLEDPLTGEVRLPEFNVAIPDYVSTDLEGAIASLPSPLHRPPAVDSLVLEGNDDLNRMIRQAWHPSVAVIGMDGLPATADAGNVLRSFTRAKVAVRVPPTADPAAAAASLVALLEADPPMGAEVTVEILAAAPGWCAPVPKPWVREALDAASNDCFGNASAAYGEGGTIPFLGMIAERFPETQIVALGVLGPGANAHGPNESLHLPLAQAVTRAVGYLLEAAHRAGD